MIYETNDRHGLESSEGYNCVQCGACLLRSSTDNSAKCPACGYGYSPVVEVTTSNDLLSSDEVLAMSSGEKWMIRLIVHAMLLSLPLEIILSDGTVTDSELGYIVPLAIFNSLVAEAVTFFLDRARKTSSGR